MLQKPENRSVPKTRASFKAIAIVTIAAAVVIALIVGAQTHAQTPGAQGALPKVTLAKTYRLAPSPLTGSFLGLSDQIAPTAVAWSPDGQKIAAISNYGNRIEVWDTNGGKPKTIEVSTGDLSNSFEFLDNDNILAPANAPMTPDAPLFGLSIWSAKDGSFIRGIASQYPNKDFRYTTYAISPDKSIAVGIQPGASGDIRESDGTPVPIYSTKTWEIIQRVRVVSPFSVAFSPDGKQIAFGTTKGVSLYDLAEARLLTTFDVFGGKAASVNLLTYSPDGNFIAASGYFFAGHEDVGNPRVVRVADGQVVASYPEHMSPWKVIWSPDGKYVAFAAHDSTIRLWDPNKSDDRGTIIRNDGSAMCLAFSPNGTQLAACSDDGIAVYNLNF